MKLASAGNVVVPAYLVLLAKGYAVEREAIDDREVWRASKGADEFIADSPLELLGVVVVSEERGADWQASDQEIQDFLRRFP